MSNRAWMPLHIADYLADTGHLTATEHGGYMLLIMHYWQNGHLPENEKLIARVARMTDAQWEESGFILMDLFSPSRQGFTAVQRAMGEVPRKVQRPAIPTNIRREVLRRDGRRCRYCGCTDGPFDIDHKLPWSRGGSHALDNLTVACAPCNRSKGALTAEEFSGAFQ